MTEAAENQQETSEETLEGGSYEIIRQRLLKQSDTLLDRMNSLNKKRKEVFGALDTKLIGQDRILTQNNCIPRDMIPIGNKLLFGYQVHMGMKTSMNVSDVFCLYEFKDNTFDQADDDFLKDKNFAKDLSDLFSYYRESRFSTFHITESVLLMVFQVGKEIGDIRAFKWNIDSDGKLTYMNSRSEREVVRRAQHDFEWARITRDQHVFGTHPHVSIEDKIFVECVGGDLTIKIEDNTEDGAGIFSEDVEHKDQTLDDSEIFYATMGSIILLKILPFREEQYRYIIYNQKTEKAVRIDDIEECAISLPEEDGLIFPRGYYLESGEFKTFDLETAKMRFRRVFPSSNGEDFLYVFYNDDVGEYILMQYNLIEKKVENPIHCHGFAVYEDGKMIFFKSDADPKKSHSIQIWQTPFVAEDKLATLLEDTESELNKIGNKDLVRGIADLRTIFNLLRTEKVYLGLYHQIVKRVTKTLDFHHWMDKEEVFKPKETLQEINVTAKGAIDEYEKVVEIRSNTENSIRNAEKEVESIELSIGGKAFKSVEEYVDTLSSLQIERGKIVSLKDMRYANMEIIDSLEEKVKTYYGNTAKNCIDFLMGDAALDPYFSKLKEYEAQIPEIEKVTKLEELSDNINIVNDSLNLLTELVNNLKIDDATKTAHIIDKISNVYSRINQVKAIYKKRLQDVHGKESKEEFGAQFKLLGQAVANYLEQATSPERCEDSLTKILVQLEELEARFSDFDDYIEKLSIKREEVYSAFNTKKVQLQEARNKRSQTLWKSADRILNGISKRSAQFKDINELNAYFASDAMVTKAGNIIEELREIGDSVRSEDLASRLKTLQQEGSRQLKDKLDLFAGGDNVISFGAHKFLVNQQSVELTTVNRDDDMFYHLTGTDFFEQITDEGFEKTRPQWNQDFISENDDIYRAEFLAYKFIMQLEQEEAAVKNKFRKLGEKVSADIAAEPETEINQHSSYTRLLKAIHEFMSGLYAEGYEKGVHDADAAKILAKLYPIFCDVGSLRYHPTTRAYAYLYWFHSPRDPRKTRMGQKIRSFGILNGLTGGVKFQERYIDELRDLMKEFFENFNYPIQKEYIHQAPEYLFEELKANSEKDADTETDFFPVNKHAFDIYVDFRTFLKQKRAIRLFNKSVKSVGNDIPSRLSIVHDWVHGFMTKKSWATDSFMEEAVVLILGETMNDKIEGNLDTSLYRDIETSCEITGLIGQHKRIEESTLRIDISDFMIRMENFIRETVPAFQHYVDLKRDLVEIQKEKMRLSEFKPRVMSSFVRNKLIDSVYLPLVGANLAKQMGAYGAEKRTDLMGLLLLISPPGYGKTTLMEYLANRLGLIFMKINGPAIGHSVMSLDPVEAPNATAREEVEKLNLALEMGNNIMIYLDDIQHTNPEFLQKFISLCDAQRKIEGVYKGKTRTYDLRGKRVAVVMAGNPYTESGEKFQVPDMLVNRADVYNLGDILGGHEEAFKLSYIENSLTSNSILSRLASRSQEDVYKMVRIAKEGSTEGIHFETNYSPTEVNEFVTIFKKLLTAQEVILKVNQQYIYSASQDEAFRTEPTFLLQGSYRNMNKMAEKIMPVMNDEELQQLVLDNYIDDSQLLTTGAEFNLLRFKEMMDWNTEEENERLAFIRKSYQKNKALGGISEGDPMSQIIGQINMFNDNFKDFADSSGKKNN